MFKLKQINTFLALIFITNCYSQIKLKVYEENVANGYTIYADNEELCPVSLKIEFQLNNLTSTFDNNKIYVIPPMSKKYTLTNLKTISNNAYKFSFKTLVNYGDNNLSLSKIPEFIYNLPFSNNKSFQLYQGYNGLITHQNENSLDFTMPIGTEILASRSGIVIKIEEKFNQNCAEKLCAAYNNFILIYHSDGTFSRYVHLKQNGVLVNVGDQVTENQLIGYSGNVGYSDGPHLHFVVYLQKLNNVETIKTKFKINDGLISKLLIEKEIYTRNY